MQSNNWENKLLKITLMIRLFLKNGSYIIYWLIINIYFSCFSLFSWLYLIVGVLVISYLKNITCLLHSRVKFLWNKRFIKNALFENALCRKVTGINQFYVQICHYENSPLASGNHETWQFFSMLFLLLYPGAEQNKNNFLPAIMSSLL